jgi:hypothetical protein
MKFSSIPLQLQAVLVLIAVFSFAISYNNLHDMALEMGIPHYLAWFFPFCIDAFLLACSIFILYAEEKGISPIEGWAFLLVYTGLSIIFNVIHSPDVFWYQVGYSACPISLCISLHLFVKITKQEMVRGEVKEEKQQIEGSSIHVCEADDTQEPEPVTCESAVTLEETIEPIPELSENRQKVLEAFMNSPEMSMAEACRQTGLSFKTVKAHYNALKEIGLLS